MTFAGNIQIKAPAQAVFALYNDVKTWPEWDLDVLAVSLPQGLVAGKKGWLKPKSGPKVKMQVTEVTQNASFTTRSQLPLCTMEVTHQITPNLDGVNVAHEAFFSGPLAPLFRKLIGQPYRQTLPDVLKALKAKAEGTGQLD